MSLTPNRGLLLSIILVVAFLGAEIFIEKAIATEPARAEYAVRWNVQNGGPQSTQQVLAILKRSSNGSEQYRVEYFDVPLTLPTPDDFPLLLRRNVNSSGRAQLTLKYRGDHALATWTCPLPKPYRTKAEVDISFTGANSINRAYSYSCTSDLKEPPTELHARSKGCSIAVTRTEGGRLTVEEWHLPGDTMLIDVSRGGPNTKEALESFRESIVEKLIKSGVNPIARSKTELSSQCK